MGRAKPLHAATLLIDQDRRFCPGRLSERIDEPDRLRRGVQVSGEQNEAERSGFAE